MARRKRHISLDGNLQCRGGIYFLLCVACAGDNVPAEGIATIAPSSNESNALEYLYISVPYEYWRGDTTARGHMINNMKDTQQWQVAENCFLSGYTDTFTFHHFSTSGKMDKITGEFKNPTPWGTGFWEKCVGDGAMRKGCFSEAHARKQYTDLKTLMPNLPPLFIPQGLTWKKVSISSNPRDSRTCTRSVCHPLRQAVVTITKVTGENGDYIAVHGPGSFALQHRLMTTFGFNRFKVQFTAFDDYASISDWNEPVDLEQLKRFLDEWTVRYVETTAEHVGE